MGMLSDAIRGKNKKRTIEIDEGLYMALEAIGGLRDVHVDTIIQIQLGSYVRAFERGKIVELEDPMPYGQYRGERLEDVIKVNPRYIGYLVSHSDTFKISDKAMEMLQFLEDNDYPSTIG